MAISKKYLIGFITLLITATLITVTMQNQGVQIKVSKTSSTFQIFENGKWNTSGVEYSMLYNGSKLLSKLDSRIEQNITGNEVIIRRIVSYPPAMLIDTYVFNGNVSTKELFPIDHYIQVINGKGLKYRYEARNLGYSGITKDITSPQSFGKNMKITWDSGYSLAKIYSTKTLRIEYPVKSNYAEYHIRLFDPILDLTNFTLYLDGVDSDRNYELGTTANIVVNLTTNGTTTVSHGLSMISGGISANYYGTRHKANVQFYILNWTRGEFGNCDNISIFNGSMFLGSSITNISNTFIFSPKIQINASDTFDFVCRNNTGTNHTLSYVQPSPERTTNQTYVNWTGSVYGASPPFSTDFERYNTKSFGIEVNNLNVSFYYTYLIIGDAINYSCGYAAYCNYSYKLEEITINKFANGSIIKNATENSIFNITFYPFTSLNSFFFTIKGINSPNTYPYNSKFSFNNTVFASYPGYLENRILSDNKTTLGYDVENITFLTSSSIIRYVNYTTNNLPLTHAENLSFSLYGFQADANTFNFTEKFLNISNTTSNFTNASSYYYYDDFSVGDTLSKWAGTYSIVTGQYLNINPNYVATQS